MNRPHVRSAWLLAIFVLIAGMAAASPVSCLTVTGDNVLDPALAAGCTLGGYTFDNFSVTSSPSNPSATVFLSSLGTGIVAGGACLGFQVTIATRPQDVVLMYHVFGQPIIGVDNKFNGAGATTIQEVVCDQAFTLGICSPGHVLASFVNPPVTMGTFAAHNSVYILKDISVPT